MKEALQKTITPTKDNVAHFLYALNQARRSADLPEAPRQLTQDHMAVVEATANRLGKSYVREILDQTDQQAAIFDTTFANLHSATAFPEIADGHHKHGHHHHHHTHEHGAKLKNEKFRRIAQVVLCQFDCTIPTSLQIAGALFGGFHGVGHQHTDPLASLPEKPGIILEIPAKEAERTLYEDEKMVVRLPLDEDPHTAFANTYLDISDSEKRKTPRKKQSQIRRKVAALTTAAAIVTGGGLLGTKVLPQSNTTQNNVPGITQTFPDYHHPFMPSLGNNKPDQKPRLTIKSIVKEGDTEWGMVDKEVGVGQHFPLTTEINMLVDLTAAWNSDKNNNPNHIIPGQEIALPSQAAIAVVEKDMDLSLDQPLPVDEKEFIHDMDVLNTLPNISKEDVVKKEKRLLGRMTTYIRSHI